MKYRVQKGTHTDARINGQPKNIIPPAQLLCRGYMWNKIISKLFQPSSTSEWNNFAWNYFKV